MKNTKHVFIVSAVIVIVTILYYYNDKMNVQIQSEKQHAPSEYTIQNLSVNNNQTRESAQIKSSEFRDNINTENAGTIPSLSLEEQAHLKAMAFFSSDAFKTTNTIKAAFINQDGSLSRNSIEMSFANNDFVQLIDALKRSDRNSASFELEAKLEQHLFRTMNNKIYDESYSCAGEVCAMIFKTLEKSDDFELIKNFSSNYSFTNVTQDDLGAYTYKAVFVETEDPTNLRLQ